ncbi:TetR/AcrR family transcriptional regulator [Streptomyces ipomoeae]|jgi:AcrR family transcriptional regulator|uniref:TetR/AcrR family transcriptional regulator n=1 Tax=Streptomyces ipomoeae TaxID=103232 RepID=A0AAE9B1R2_9ACTN|nr:TetR/AcrR family transcriptional regulator [Streptomyces ipomoeae]MDX2694595.1 TetR/AcrR family transcriptional regulator [Streptomyces ipomoeae]MDX2822715.1 TetR/AcrR family transcriptional regulator [Streptomyces ipomoeae]MDX2837815.1 TetR/AcrR family transcriptional regulator [Streptomyces ipomoeae]MDX2875401.1 TetR/AcrR family transcriptional regulator [Streptomyces ipomoeae]TQE31759.1 TetR/AcrR family transcriptional regulator [Streptomyces ipomoeae]
MSGQLCEKNVLYHGCVSNLVTASGRRPTARERLLSTASRLFYTEGIRAVGVDRIMAEAEIARGTFYRHFEGKDDLVRAYLEARDQGIRDRVGAVREEIADPSVFLQAMARGIGEELCGAGFRGCPFINAAAEYPERDSVVHQAVLTHRAWFHQILQDAFEQTGAPDPARSADAMVAMRDGAMVAGYLSDPQKAKDTLVHGVTALLAAP